MIEVTYLKEQYKLKNLPKEVVKEINAILNILDLEYGNNRDKYADCGGYVVVVEDIVNMQILKSKRIYGIRPEYTDKIECSEGVNWTSSLFLLSSDYSIVVVTTEELSKFLLE